MTNKDPAELYEFIVKQNIMDNEGPSRDKNLEIRKFIFTEITIIFL